MTWVVILLGAEASYLSGKLDIISTISQYRTQMGEMGGLLGLRLLLITARRYLNGDPLPTEGELAVETGVDPSLIRLTLDFLTGAELLSQSDPKLHSRTLMCAPSRILVSDVLDTFRIDSPDTAREEKGTNGNRMQSGDYFVEFLRRASLKMKPEQSFRETTLSELAQEGLSNS